MRTKHIVILSLNMEKSFVVNYVPTLLSVNQKSELMLGQPIVSPMLSKVF